MNGRIVEKGGLLIFFLALLAFMWAMSRHVYHPTTGEIQTIIPQVFSGDEPHYLMVVNSILFDRDLELQDDYRRVGNGSFQAGVNFKGKWLDHHTILVDPKSGRTQVWNSVFKLGERETCSGHDCVGFKRMSPEFQDLTDVREFSSHPIGFPGLIAILLAPFPLALWQVEEGMLVIILIVSWITLVLTYILARRLGLTALQSLFGVFLLAFASPWLVYSRSYYAEPILGFFLVLGIFAMSSHRPIFAGLAICVALWIKPPFLLVGIGWLLERFLSREWKQGIYLGLMMGLGGMIFLTFNYFVTGKLFIGGNADLTQAWGFPSALTLYDMQYGLLLFVPWLLILMVGGVAFLLNNLKIGPEATIFVRQVWISSLLFFLLISAYIYLGGSCYGPRFWVPFLPLFAVATILFVVQAGKFIQWLAWGLGILSVFIAIPGAIFYRNVWDQGPFAGLRILLPHF